MRKSITQLKNPHTSLAISGSNVSYDISLSKCMVNTEITSSRASGGQGCSIISRKTNRYEILRQQNKNYKQIFLAGLLQQMYERRKRYSFQMIKLLYMFPDDTFSENYSVNSYDRLFFHEEHVHTIVKIYQTKEMEAKIWAFLNLKNLHIKRKLEKFTIKIEKVSKNIKQKKVKYTFDTIRQFSIRIKPQVVVRPVVPVIVERKQPIQTRIEPPKIIEKVICQPAKNNITTRETNQIIRISAVDSSPLVRRIELSPNDVKVVYPSSSTNISSTSQINERRQIRSSAVNVISPSKINNQYVKEIETKISYPTRTYISDQKRIQYHRPNPATYSEQTVKKIQPVPIQQSVSYVKPNEVREIRGVNRLYSGHELIHTVHGDCTINIHNACNHGQEKQRAQILIRQSRAKQAPHCSHPSIAQHIPVSSHNIHACYSCSCGHISNCMHHCGGCCRHFQGQPNYMRGHMSNSFYKIPDSNYSLQERIQYMRHLEHLADKINKFQINKFAKE